MDPVAAVTGIALLAGVVTAAGLIGVRLGRAAGEKRPLLWLRMLAREGVCLDGCGNAGAFRQVAVAARRCLLCNEHEQCASWLDGRSAMAPGRFCPNADLIAVLGTEARANALLRARKAARTSPPAEKLAVSLMRTPKAAEAPITRKARRRAALARSPG